MESLLVSARIKDAAGSQPLLSTISRVWQMELLGASMVAVAQAHLLHLVNATFQEILGPTVVMKESIKLSARVRDVAGIQVLTLGTQATTHGASSRPVVLARSNTQQPTQVSQRTGMT
jgi:hypothetical protein